MSVWGMSCSLKPKNWKYEFTVVYTRGFAFQYQQKKKMSSTFFFRLILAFPTLSANTQDIDNTNINFFFKKKKGSKLKPKNWKHEFTVVYTRGCAFQYQQKKKMSSTFFFRLILAFPTLSANTQDIDNTNINFFFKKKRKD
jgi:hypothetical protein